MRKPLFQKKIFPQITSDLMTSRSPLQRFGSQEADLTRAYSAEVKYGWR